MVRKIRIGMLLLGLIALMGMAPQARADGWWPNSGCTVKHTTASAASIHSFLLNVTRGWWHGWHVHQWGDGFWRCHQRS